MFEVYPSYRVLKSCERLQNLQWYGVENVPDKPDLKFTFEEDAISETLEKFYALELEAIQESPSNVLMSQAVVALNKHFNIIKWSRRQMKSKPRVTKPRTDVPWYLGPK